MRELVGATGRMDGVQLVPNERESRRGVKKARPKKRETRDQPLTTLRIVTRSTELAVTKRRPHNEPPQTSLPTYVCMYVCPKTSLPPFLWGHLLEGVFSSQRFSASACDT
jgi:hypothetical protein